MSVVDRPMRQPERHFWKLATARFQLEEMASRYPSQNADYQALLKAVRTLDETARHFGLEALWFKGVWIRRRSRPTQRAYPAT